MTHPLPDKAVEAVAEAMSCGVCQTCGTPATGSHGGVTECNCIRPTWREATASEKARAAITAYLSALAAEGLVVVPREPTQAMLDAIVTYPAELVAARNDPAYTAQMQAATLAERALAAQRYRAMIEAAREG
jgi:hypothetical protein